MSRMFGLLLILSICLNANALNAASLLPKLTGLVSERAAAVKHRVWLRRRATKRELWTIMKTYEGPTFFDEWNFYDGPDEAHGLVDYVNRSTAFASGLTYFSEGRAYIQVDNWTPLTLAEITSVNQTKLRRSVRITTQAQYNHVLVILDVAQIPFGCATWPGFRSKNGNWPVDGEINIIESVHNSSTNQVSWHTTAGCLLTSPGDFTGIAGGTNCDHGYNNNTGCGILDQNIASLGPTLNEKGGGVYAMRWDGSSINVWFFHRIAIPSDIHRGLPDPTRWFTPFASLLGDGCPIDKHFRNHELMIDTRLCGDWAGASYAASGCPRTCSERVVDPSNFINAIWSINSIKVYNRTIFDT